MKGESGIISGLIGSCEPMQEVYRMTRRVAPTTATVLLTGETGTGKELIARALHELSPRATGPFIRVNCGALSESLLESELFGHVKGAFTGATRDKVGVFQAAEGGTLFLDEIGDVSPLIQLKLLRVLQEREIRRVGDDKPMKVDVRLLTATNRDLMSLIKAGEFREDFYYRIHVFEVHLPALRERKEDIPLLTGRFIDELSQVHRDDVSGIARDALQRMMDYHWPGNVRELRNAIEHAFVTVGGDVITLFDLPSEIRVPRSDSDHTRQNALHTPEKSTLPETRPPETKPFDIGDLTPKQQTDREKVLTALKETEGNKTAAAKLLGVSRVTMWKKVRKYGIDWPR